MIKRKNIIMILALLTLLISLNSIALANNFNETEKGTGGATIEEFAAEYFYTYHDFYRCKWIIKYNQDGTTKSGYPYIIGCTGIIPG